MNFYEVLTEDLWNGVHDLSAHTFRAALSNTLPDAAADELLAHAAEIAAGNGYVTGGIDVQAVLSRTGATTSLIFTDVTWNASGGSIANFRYVVIYNATAAGSPLVGYYDTGQVRTITDGNSFKTDFAATSINLAPAA